MDSGKSKKWAPVGFPFVLVGGERGYQSFYSPFMPYNKLIFIYLYFLEVLLQCTFYAQVAAKISDFSMQNYKNFCL